MPDKEEFCPNCGSRTYTDVSNFDILVCTRCGYRCPIPEPEPTQMRSQAEIQAKIEEINKLVKEIKEHRKHCDTSQYIAYLYTTQTLAWVIDRKKEDLAIKVVLEIILQS